MREFQRQFASEEACQDYLATCRWPEGFRCRRCGHTRAYRLVKQRRWQCAACRDQVSLTAGTILHNTKTPLTAWFWAAYLTVTDKRGISALLLQRQLELRRYETAWMLLHKLRRAMVNAVREPLQGDVEIDDTGSAAHNPDCVGVASSRGGKPRLCWRPWKNEAKLRIEFGWLWFPTSNRPRCSGSSRNTSRRDRRSTPTA